MIYDRKPKKVEAFRITEISWNSECGYTAKFDDGSQRHIPFRGPVPNIGDYWIGDRYESQERFESEYEQTRYPQEVFVGRIQ